MPPAASTYDAVKAASVPVLRWRSITAAGVDAAITTRHAGVSHGPYESLNLGLHVGDDNGAVIENRARAAAAIGLQLDDLVFCRQAHGNKVVRVGASDRGRGARSDDDALPDADALVTTEPDVGLVVMVADCVPIVLVDPHSSVLSCVHAGWRGTVARVTEAAVERMVALGASRGAILAGVGPAVTAERYHVGSDVVDAVTATFGDAAGSLVRADGNARWTFDLHAANLQLLDDAGVDRANVALIPLDTASGDFFSDRAVRPCGRFAAIARLRP